MSAMIVTRAITRSPEHATHINVDSDQTFSGNCELIKIYNFKIKVHLAFFGTRTNADFVDDERIFQFLTVMNY